MTLRELFQIIDDWRIDLYYFITIDVWYWIKDVFEKLSEGNILDLTIGQIAFILFLVLMIFWGLINDYTKRKRTKENQNDFD